MIYPSRRAERGDRQTDRGCIVRICCSASLISREDFLSVSSSTCWPSPLEEAIARGSMCASRRRPKPNGIGKRVETQRHAPRWRGEGANPRRFMFGHSYVLISLCFIITADRQFDIGSGLTVLVHTHGARSASRDSLSTLSLALAASRSRLKRHLLI